MSDRLAGPRAKVKRAYKHFLDLESARRQFIDGNPHFLREYVDPKTAERVFVAEVIEPPPPHLSTIAGDAIHNLRSALDLLVWQLVLDTGKTPTEKTAFPMWWGPKELEAATHDVKVQGASKHAIEFIVETKPYRGADNALWALHRLDIADKHHLLSTVVSVLAGFALTRGATTYGFSPLPERALIPLKHGVEVYRIPHKRHSAESEREDNLKPVAEIAFGDVEIVKGEPVIPVLMQFFETVHGIVESAAPLFKHG